MGFSNRVLLWMMIAVLAFALPLALGCGDDDDDDDSGPGVDDDDDITDDDSTDDDVTDDDDDTTDDDDDTTDDDTTDDDDDSTPPTTEGFVYIPAGTFTMGSPANEQGRDENEAEHEVTLSFDFEMYQTETTQSFFEQIMGYNPSFYPRGGQSPNRPVEQVSWYDALAFANKLSASESYDECFVLTNIECADETAGDTTDYCKDNGGIALADVALNDVGSVYSCEGFRLPTESEWEYAVRAGTTTAFYNGDITFNGCDNLDPNLDQISWYCGNGKMTTHDAAKKDPNAWDLYDMAGNVLEWTWDNYATAYPGTVTDPEGPTDGDYKSARGGSIRWHGAARNRSAYRAAHTPNWRDRHLGFRLVRTLEPTAQTANNATGTPDRIGWDSDFTAKWAQNWPTSLPFTYTRTDVGTPLTQQEITDFTVKITGFYKDTNLFDWLRWTGHGMSDTNPQNYPDYKLYWQDTVAIKTGSTVDFEHRGGADNIMIRTGKFMENVSAIYLATDDPDYGRIIEQYSKGIVALIRGTLGAEEDPVEFIMARAIFTQDNEYTEDGRHATVTYGPAKVYKEDWNAHTIPNDGNPDWGDIWVRNMRSKDDVPHIFRLIPMLKKVVTEGADASVRQAAALALEYLTGFTRDIVDSGMYIRTKNIDGNAYIPLDDNGLVNDLASFKNYDFIISDSECTNELAAALIAYGNDLNIDCGNGYGSFYEIVAGYQHYFNWAIIRYFHLAALNNALITGNDAVALDMLEGVEERVNDIMIHEYDFSASSEWDADGAAYLVAAAAAGLPLTSEETQLIVEQYSQSVDHYLDWDLWDLWDASVPDGTYEYKPGRDAVFGKAVRFPEMVYFLEYCGSPFRNDTGAEVVDCDIILDPSQWGQYPG